jgi:hypothetical protein
MSNASAAIAACEKTAKDIQDTVVRNQQKDADIANQRQAKKRDLDNLKDQHRNFRGEPSRNKGDYPRLETGCIRDGDIGRRGNEARNRCNQKTDHGGGYEYDGNYWSCGGWNACCEFNHNCSKSDNWLNRNWEIWRDEKNNLQNRIDDTQRDIDNLKPAYEPVPSFQCCPNIVQVVGSEIKDTSINQMNQCISDMKDTLNKPPPKPTPTPPNTTPPNTTPKNIDIAPNANTPVKKEVIAAIVIGIIMCLCICIILSSLLLI